jgi:hypothetical protein
MVRLLEMRKIIFKIIKMMLIIKLIIIKVF